MDNATTTLMSNLKNHYVLFYQGIEETLSDEPALRNLLLNKMSDIHDYVNDPIKKEILLTRISEITDLSPNGNTKVFLNILFPDSSGDENNEPDIHPDTYNPVSAIHRVLFELLTENLKDCPELLKILKQKEPDLDYIVDGLESYIDNLYAFTDIAAIQNEIDQHGLACTSLLAERFSQCGVNNVLNISQEWFKGADVIVTGEAFDMQPDDKYVLSHPEAKVIIRMMMYVMARFPCYNYLNKYEVFGEMVTSVRKRLDVDPDVSPVEMQSIATRAACQFKKRAIKRFVTSHFEGVFIQQT